MTPIPTDIRIPQGYEATTLSPLNKAWGEVDGAQVRVSPDGTRAIAWWQGYRRTSHRRVTQFATWTARAGWRRTETMTGQTGSLAVNPDVTVAAFVGSPGEDNTDAPGPVTLRVLDIATGEWTKPSTAPMEVSGELNVGSVHISDDGKVVMAAASRRNYANDTDSFYSVTWTNGTAPVVAAMPGLNRYMTLAADGSTAFLVYVQGSEVSFDPPPEAVMSSSYTNGAWAAPQPVPVGDASKVSEELRPRMFTTVANPDMSRIMLIWGEGDDAYADPEKLGTAYWERGVWRPGETVPGGTDIQIRANDDGNRVLVTYATYKPLKVFPYGRLSGAFRWWTPAGGWTKQAGFPSAGAGLENAQVYPALTPDGKHAGAVLGVVRWRGGDSEIVFRPTLWTGSSWTRPQAIRPETWSKVKYKDYGGGFLSLTGSGNAAFYASADSVGDNNTYSIARWTQRSGWSGRTTVLSREPHGSVSATAFSDDGRVSITLVNGLSGSRGLIAISPRR